MAARKPRVALLFRGDRDARDRLLLADSRLSQIAEAMQHEGIEPEPAVFSESFADEVRRQLLAVDAALVWVDPFTETGDRSVLDALLCDVAANGVLVSAHPDTIVKMGTKEVLYATRQMAWGCDTRMYRTLEDFRRDLPAALLTGKPRVLKQYRGNGGNGVFKVELQVPAATDVSSDTPLKVRHARRGSVEEILTFDQLVDSLSHYFNGNGRVIDQPWQERMVEGMIRCYFVSNKVAGFGEQLVNALYPSDDPNEPVKPGPRLYYPPTRVDFLPLARLLESTWLAEMQRLLGVSDDELPIIWDADFLRGEKTAAGEDTYVLCEINVSAVYPFPDEALVPLARETFRRLRQDR